MTHGNIAAGAAASAGANAAAAQAIQALQTMGPIVKVEPAVWRDLAVSSQHQVVVHAEAGSKWFGGIKQRYLVNAHGLFFWTDAPEPLDLPAEMVVIEAESVTIP